MSKDWNFIENLPENWQTLASAELQSLLTVWKENAERLESRDAYRLFYERLKREWAIETGIIENLYSLDRGTTELLIEHGVVASLIPHGATNKPSEEVVLLIKDQESVLDGLFDFVAGRRTLSTSYIKELHSLFTLHQDVVEGRDANGKLVETPLLKGEWKQQLNNPKRPDGEIHEYCPPEHVAAEMDGLIKMHLMHMKLKVPPEVEGAWFHHRFTQIHPFQDGNGRVARAMTSLIFLQKEWFPLVIDRDSRGEYISALESADEGSLSPLVDLFVKKQKKAFLKALSLSESALKDQEQERLQQVYSTARQRIEKRKETQIREMQEISFSLAGDLEKIVKDRLEQEASALNKNVLTLYPDYYSRVQSNDDINRDWFYKQISETANELEYFADTRTYKTWIRLKIKEERQAELIFSFHGLGYEFVGILAVSAFMEYRDKGEGGITSIDGPYTISKEAFNFSYVEPLESIKPRFEEWLNEVILFGLDQWGRQL